MPNRILPTALILGLGLLTGCALKTGANADANANAANTAAANAARPTQTPAQAAATATPAGQSNTQTQPDAVVADLYRQSKKKSPFFQTDDRALVDRYFVKATADLIWKDAVESKGEVGALEADPLYDAQDTEIKNFQIGQPEIKDGRAQVVVSFLNFGKKDTLTYLLTSEGGVWKITDIKYDEGRSLVSMLKGE